MEKAAPTTPDSKKVSIPLVMTRNTEQGLADLGYTKTERNKMTPEEGMRIVDAGVPKEKQKPVAEKTTETKKKNERKIFKAAVIDATKLVEAQARDIADHKMTESKEDRSKNWFSRKISQIWTHNLAQEYTRHKMNAEANGEILSSGNLYQGESADTAAHTDAMNSIITRFTSEYEDDMLKGTEKASKKPKSQGANADIKKLIEKYAADPTMTKEAFKKEEKILLSGIDKAYVKENTLYANNLFEIATEVRDSVTHGEKLDEMDFEVELTLGKAQESLNTESKQSLFEKM
jgi:hypothetical protein